MNEIHPAQALPEAAPPRRENLVLMQANQLVLQLQAEVAAQDQREQTLAEWEQRLARQEQALAEARRQYEQTQEGHQARLTLRELALHDGEARLLERERDLLEMSAQQDAARIQLEADKEHQHAAWLAETAMQRADLARQQQALEAAQAALAASEQALQERNRVELQQARQDLWESLSSEWQIRQADWERERALWHQERAEREQSLATQQATYTAALGRLDDELAARRRTFEAELATQRQTTLAELETLRCTQEEALSATAAEQQRERVVYETRLRFQQDHLEKARADVEQSQTEFRIERQRERQLLADLETQSQRRMVQLQLYREALEEQARSLDRERETLSRVRHATEDVGSRWHEAIEAERLAWQQERSTEQARLERQQTLVAQQLAAIDGKRLRMERLRQELEDTHRTNLELRLAVEEAWAQIAQAMGSDEEARLRVEQARQALALYYQELHAGLTAQRRELAERESRQEAEFTAFHAERQSLAEWFSERDAALRLETTRQREAARETATVEAGWQSAREHWLAEKLEAEGVIRRLLAELGERHRNEMLLTWTPAAAVWADNDPTGAPVDQSRAA